MADTLRDLIQSTQALYERFGQTPQHSIVKRVFEEEVAELIEATEEGLDHQHIAEEAADVFVTAIGMCLAAGLDTELLIRQAHAVIAKNNAKTHETHAINEYGKIARR
ncbi:MAG: hypothetical protein GYB66_14805 [Chloroflexi bacterium]|nr:hypothetical protein [Chloroflexota bacterium]